MFNTEKRNNPEVRVFEDRQLMGKNAASAVSAKITELLRTQDEVNIIFAAAPSQNEVLEALCLSKHTDWTRINAFHMDEYIGLKEEAPQAFGNFLKTRLFSKLPFKSVNYLNGTAENIEKECDRYSRLLNEFPADIVCMGIGENGHIAFNDPPVANFRDKLAVKVVELDAVCRQQQVNDGCFDALEKVPIRALTLTIPALMKAHFIYCVVPGTSKARAVYNTLHQNVNEKYPSSILRNHPGSILFLDELSASLL
ncbi:glucosamine-6-phosphate deaminase [Arcticibacter tournemirensis]|uniref:Glucosamine-6-phosphate deaminase n=1 Tax=Arcticibacter tournemirensis TaxID=699437 RepID=A0A5M9HAT7_9SPHI|nr:glucosamine-6-phosphate deaminase [Arcticibacter tournemirensis]KAA8482861.1 glucosamine-6-phosphate deaminase [Arcticibacter tournemirensis]TQM49761.1 glucosamine-6-phosphate deaminase [Arcticibacter tournemirensis]